MVWIYLFVCLFSEIAILLMGLVHMNEDSISLPCKGYIVFDTNFWNFCSGPYHIGITGGKYRLVTPLIHGRRIIAVHSAVQYFLFTDLFHPYHFLFSWSNKKSSDNIKQVTKSLL